MVAYRVQRKAGLMVIAESLNLREASDELDDVPAFFFGDDFADADGHAGAGTAVFQHPHHFAICPELLPFTVGEVAR